MAKISANVASRRRLHRVARHSAVGLALLASSAWLAACGDSSSSHSGSSSSEQVVFSPEGNNLWAYETTPPFVSQKVNAAFHTFDGTAGDPNAWDINGEICTFKKGGKQYLVSGEDTHQPDPPAGWGIFELTGKTVGEFAVKRVARLVPTYQATADGPDNYGCGVLSDGRILTTDIGNQAGGSANGQLIIWFPPFNGDTVSFCKLDVHLATGQGIYVGKHDTLYLNSPRTAPEADATAAGVFKYSGPFPTSADAKGGCGRIDNLGSPLVDTLHKERVLAAGADGLNTPSGIAGGANGHFFVASVISGVINEYDANWQYVQTVLRPPAGERLGAQPYSTGTPLGLSVGDDGTLYYADIGIVIGNSGVGPGNQTGSLRRITFAADGTPHAPEILADTLEFPDGLGLWPR
ncbi:MAG: hypothetical protein ABI629_18420 [bacterium]